MFQGTCRMSHPRTHTSEQFTIRKISAEKWKIGQCFVANAETCTSRTELEVTADQEMGYLCSEPLSPETRKALGSAQHRTWQHVLESEPRRCKMHMRPWKSHLFTILSNGLRWGAGHGINSLIWCLGDYRVSSLSLDIHFSVYIFIINFTASYIHLNSSCDSINILSVFKELSSDIFQRKEPQWSQLD